MRTVFVTPYLPGQSVGAGVRAYALLEAYAALGEVVGVSLATSLATDSDWKDKCADVRLVQFQDLLAPLYYWEMVPALLPRGRSAWDCIHFSDGTLKMLAETCARADVVHVFQQAFYPVRAAGVDLARVVWDIDENAAAKARSNPGADIPPWGKIPSFLHATFTANLDRQIQRDGGRCAQMLVASRRECENFPGLKNLSVVPNIIAKGLDGQFRLERPVGPPRLLFVGSLGYGPNLDALRFACEEIWPRVRAKEPKARLEVVGRAGFGGGGFVMATPGVSVHTDVSAMQPYYERATVAIAPILWGGGTRIKILEAMSFGVPVVTTTIGCEGLAVEDEREVLIADTPKGFADACLRLLKDCKLGEHLALASRDFLAKHHSQDCVNGVIADVVGAITPNVVL